MASNRSPIRTKILESKIGQLSIILGRVDQMDEYFKKFDIEVSGFSPVDRLRQLYETKFLSDVVLISKKNGQSYKTHKFILGITSQLFLKLFQNSPLMEEFECDSDPFAIEWFLMHAYGITDSFPSDPPKIIGVYSLLETFEMFEVLKRLRDYMGMLISMSNIDDFYLAAVDHKDSELQRKCFEYVINNCLEITRKAESDGNVSKRVLKLAVGQDSLGIAEIEIFNAVIKWAKKQLDIAGDERNGQNVRKTLGSILKEIDFFNIEMDELMNQVYKANIFSDGEMDIILQMRLAVNSVPLSEVPQFPEFPKDLSSKPRIRNNMNAANSLKSVLLGASLICNYKAPWRSVNGVELALIQVNRGIQIFGVKSRTECYVGTSKIEVFCNEELVGVSSVGPNWQFKPPVNILKDETYMMVLAGGGKALKHHSSMFSVTAYSVEFCGKCPLCELTIEFKSKINLF